MRALSKTLTAAAIAAIGSFAVEHATAVPPAATVGTSPQSLCGTAGRHADANRRNATPYDQVSAS